MLILYAFVIGIVFPTCLGEVSVYAQPPYQGVYIYQEVGTSLLGISSCEDLSDLNNVTRHNVGLLNNTACTYQGENVTLSLISKESPEPPVNSTNAKFYLLPTQDTQLEELPSGWFSTNVSLLCWDGSSWTSEPGLITKDLKHICCDKRSYSHDREHCSDVIFLDKDRVLEEGQERLEVGHGFEIGFRTSLWPIDEVHIELTCGSYTCGFKGEETNSWMCSNLAYHSIYSEKSNRPFHEEWRPLQSSIHEHPHNLNLTVPYLNYKFKGADKCLVFLKLSGVEVAKSTLPLVLMNSDPVVAESSNVGLVDVRHFSYVNPRCIGDGWPLPNATWWFQNDKGRFIKDPRFSGKKLKAGTEFKCIASREDLNSSGDTKHMMFVEAPVHTSLCSDKSKIIAAGMETSITCRTNLDDWNPKPHRLGWTHPNGEEVVVWNLTNLGEGAKLWNVKLEEEGIYKCWAEIDKTWTDPEQNDTFRLERDVRAVSVGSLTKIKTVTDAESNTTKPVTSESKSNTLTTYWYLITLGILVLFLAVSTTFIYKIVKKNQAKVSNLDTKLSLDKVRTKMGVNALYADVAIEEEQPLLARIPRIAKEDLVTDRVLGAGQFGKVLKGRLTVTDEDGVPGEIDVAVKCLMHPDDQSSTEDFLKEMVMMYSLDHPNVIKLLGICTEYDQYMIVLEFMAHGNLRDFLMHREQGLSLVDKLYICYQVVCGLEHMVAQNIVHRDIAARNCLVGPNLVVKVADFGLSRSLAMSNYYKKVGGQVPIRWMSPEALKYGKYTPESDVWAFGVLMWEVYTEGHFPYSGYSNEEVQGMLENGFKLHVPPHCTEDISVLMQATWEIDPAKRPNFRTIRTRLNQMLRNSDVSNILYSSASPDSLPSTSTQESQDAALGDSIPIPESKICSPRDTLTRASCFAGESSGRTGCFLGEESSSGTITNNEVATNRYAKEPGVVSETTL